MTRFVHVLLEYPVLSQTFVRDEIDALREAGAAVLTVSLEDGPGADLAVGTWSARSPRVIADAARLLLRRPAAARLLASGPLTIGYRVKLLAAAERARRWGATAVHAHFAYRSADGAEVIGRALGTGHSVTVHAQDMFVTNPHLDRRLRAARVVVTVCEYNRRHLLADHAGAVGDRLAVVPCSTRVDVEPAVPAPGRPVVLAVGRLVPKKGLDTLVRAAARLRCAATVVIVGEGPERDALDHLVADLGVGDRVELTGALPHDEVRERFSTATIFCVPFRIAPDGDRDSMPVVVKEAMAYGLAVVSTREVAVPEMVDDGVTGLLVAPDDADALADALDGLLADPARRAEMGEAARHTVAERFDLRDQARRLLELLG